ncbi:MAG: phosphodiester glycosidase family protein, partial [Acidimicrobiia bacterium]
MRRIPPVVMAVLALVVSGAPARSATGLPDGYVLDAQRELVAGVEHSVLTRDDPASAVNVARIAPGAPVALRAVSSDNGINHHGDKLETPSSMCRRVGCVVAVNGDFHHVAEREPVGGVISDGRMLRSPVGGRPQLVVTTDGRIVAAPLDWTGLVDTGGADLAMRGINTTTHPDDGRIVLYTPDWGTHTETDDAAEIVVRSDGPLAVLGRPTQVELTSFSTDGDATIPADGAVLSATGAGAAALAELWDDVEAGTVPATAEILVDSPVDAAESLGGNPKLLSDGQAVFPDADDGFTTDRHSRTVVGWNGQGEVFVVAVDGRQDDSQGMDLAELADFMIEIGATEAINLDGGGGTTFVVDGIVTNTPIHQGEEGHERGSSNALVVVPTAAPPTPG